MDGMITSRRNVTATPIWSIKAYAHNPSSAPQCTLLVFPFSTFVGWILAIISSLVIR